MPCHCGVMASLERVTCRGASLPGWRGNRNVRLLYLHFFVCFNSARLQDLTSEEVTARRRAQRKQFKLDRARAIAAVAEEAEAVFAAEGQVTMPALSGPAIPSGATWRPSQPLDNPLPEPVDQKEEPPEDIEHLQLTLQEAFFLAWAIDCLTILDSRSVSMRLRVHIET